MISFILIVINWLSQPGDHPKGRLAALPRDAVRRVERSAAPRGDGLRLAHAEPGDRRPDLRVSRRVRALPRRQDGAGAADQGLRARRAGHGQGRSQRRRDLRLQSQQPHRDPDLAVRHRVPAGQPAQGRDRAAGRGLPALLGRPAVPRPGGGGQGSDHYPYLLQDLWDGRAAGRRPWRVPTTLRGWWARRPA